MKEEILNLEQFKQYCAKNLPNNFTEIEYNNKIYRGCKIENQFFIMSSLPINNETRYSDSYGVYTTKIKLEDVQNAYIAHILAKYQGEKYEIFRAGKEKNEIDLCSNNYLDVEKGFKKIDDMGYFKRLTFEEIEEFIIDRELIYSKETEYEDEFFKAKSFR